MSYVEKTLGKNEHVILTTRRHIIVLIRFSLRWIGLFIVALAAAIWLAVNLGEPTFTPGTAGGTFKTVVVLALFALAIVSAVALVFKYIGWYYEEYIITNQRVIRITGFVNKDEIDFSLNMINNLEVSQTLWGRLFHYGTIEVETASEEGITGLTFIPNPIDFRKAILDAKNDMFTQQPASAVLPGQALPNVIMCRTNLTTMPHPPNNEHVIKMATLSLTLAINNRTTTSLPATTTRLLPIAPINGVLRPQDIPAMIQQLAKLRDAGVMTEAEFQAKKNDLLSRM